MQKSPTPIHFCENIKAIDITCSATFRYCFLDGEVVELGWESQ